MLAILLFSIISIAVDISGSALIDSSRIEQERMQEDIVIAGPKAIQLSGSIVEKIRVNNTGSITVRIRTLYIDHEFICDPSEFDGDAYIEPKGSIWIQLNGNVNPPIEFDGATVNSNWTVTTERGTAASELGGRLLWGEPGSPYTPNKFYYGPLMLVFDMFHWRSGSGPWNNGWNISKNTENVIWRILLVNIDERPINITETSCFTLISNDNAPKDPKPWYIDPTLSPTILEPGVYHFIYYKWSKPASKGGAKEQGMNGFGDGTTCINFLTFFGYFEEADGTRTAFGQTIPFEAVHVTS